jgi:hypothetical protein
MKLNVPYKSQYKEIENKVWKGRSCTITAISMALDFLLEKSKSPDINTLLEEALNMNAYNVLSGGYWTHQKIAFLAHNHGVLSYAEEFRSRPLGAVSPLEEKMREQAMSKFAKCLDSGALIIFSMPKKWTEEEKYHSALLVGYEKEEGSVSGFYYHDPDTDGEEKGDYLFVSRDTFLSNWRGLSIILGSTFY